MCASPKGSMWASNSQLWGTVPAKSTFPLTLFVNTYFAVTTDRWMRDAAVASMIFLNPCRRSVLDGFLRHTTYTSICSCVGCMHTILVDFFGAREVGFTRGCKTFVIFAHGQDRALLVRSTDARHTPLSRVRLQVKYVLRSRFQYPA